MNENDLRISDAEREQAAATLGEHYAQGRLGTDEHAERLDRVWAARTRGELTPIFRDLPGPAREAPVRRDPFPTYWSGRRRGPWPVPFVLVMAVLIFLTVVTHIPFVLAGLLVGFFVFSRHRRRHWGNRGWAHRV